VPEILDFLHEQRGYLRDLYLMPLVATWEGTEWDYSPDRMTTEDVERILEGAFENEKVQFIALGVAADLAKVAQYLGQSPLPYQGAHPNCESFYLLASDGERYLPISHFLKSTLPEVVADLQKVESRLRRWDENGEPGSWRRTRGRLMITRCLIRHLRLGRVLKGWGPAKIWHALLFGTELALRLKSREVRRRHLAIQGLLRVIVLPLEDNPILETDRLERCPSAHVYYNPRTDEFKYIPVCSWRMYNKAILQDLAEYYGAETPAEGVEVAVS
jgi:hypothetical protein